MCTPLRPTLISVGTKTPFLGRLPEVTKPPLVKFSNESLALYMSSNQGSPPEVRCRPPASPGTSSVLHRTRELSTSSLRRRERLVLIAAPVAPVDLSLYFFSVGDAIPTPRGGPVWLICQPKMSCVAIWFPRLLSMTMSIHQPGYSG